MGEVWVNGGFAVIVVAHSNGPVPEAVEDAASVWIRTPDKIDRDEFREALNESIRGLPHVLDEHHEDFSWGASGASLTFVLRIASDVLEGVASTYIVEKLRDIARERGWTVTNSTEIDRQLIPERARKLVAECIDAGTGEVIVESLDETPWGVEARCHTPVGTFVVEYRQDRPPTVRRVVST